MKHLPPRLLLALFPLLVLAGCQAPGTVHAPPAQDREAILGMAGTYSVSFKFEEVLALRDGYELHEPYETSADELVIVVADEPGYISLQHLLVVRHDGGVHVINHWRQDWRYEAASAYFYIGSDAWRRMPIESDRRQGQWVQTVYNVADSPRYSSVGSWQHASGVSTWVGSQTTRPLPLREKHLEDEYDELASTNTHVVSDRGWLHLQDNHKLDLHDLGVRTLSVERGTNRYTRIPDEGFDKAHEYWKNTQAYWQVVRGVWEEVLADNETLALRSRWKGDALFSHLFGLADEYWGAADASDARPRIEEIINAFVIE